MKEYVESLIDLIKDVEKAIDPIEKRGYQYIDKNLTKYNKRRLK